jgi:hypothetical protein
MIGNNVTATDCAGVDGVDRGVIVTTGDQLAERFSNTARATGAAENAFGHPA